MRSTYLAAHKGVVAVMLIALAVIIGMLFFLCNYLNQESIAKVQDEELSRLLAENRDRLFKISENQMVNVENDEDVRKELVLPIIMYHSVIDDERKLGQYIITPQRLEADITYLKNNGYNTIFMQDLINWVYKGTELPPKPVMLTFDDGYYNNFLYLPDIAERNDVKLIISVVGEYCERYQQLDDNNPYYAQMDWREVEEIAENPRIEIQNHSYDMHSIKKRRGSAKLPNESSENYRDFFIKDVLTMQNELAQKALVTATTFTYPFGQISDESQDFLLEMGFLASLSCYEHINYLSGSAEELFQLGRFNRDGRLTTNEFMLKLGL